MSASNLATCEACGRPGEIRVTEVRDGTVAAERALCAEHAPPEVPRWRLMRRMTPAEEAAHYGRVIGDRAATISDPVERAAFVADMADAIEPLIGEAEAARIKRGSAD